MAKAKKDIKKVVLAYSGGLDTSIIIPWLKENYNNCEVIAVSADVGQGTELDGLEEKAIKTGASKLIVLDLKKTFVEDYIFPTVQAGAVYENRYLLGTSFARPIIGKELAKIATGRGRRRYLPRLQPARATTRFVSSWLSRHTLRIWQIIAPWRDMDHQEP